MSQTKTLYRYLDNCKREASMHMELELLGDYLARELYLKVAMQHRPKPGHGLDTATLYLQTFYHYNFNEISQYSAQTLHSMLTKERLTYEQYIHAVDLWRTQDESDARSEVWKQIRQQAWQQFQLHLFGDDLATRQAYHSTGLAAIHHYLIERHHWLPHQVKCWKASVLQSLLTEEMQGWQPNEDQVHFWKDNAELTSE